MYPIDVSGGGITARATLLACRLAGFEDLRWVNRDQDEEEPPAWTLSANLTKVVQALGRGNALVEAAHCPDREQVRIADSGFLLSELPLGKFSNDRYGAPHVNIDQQSLCRVLDPDLRDEQPNTPATVLVETTVAQEAQPTSTHTLWHASLSQTEPDSANVTWLGPHNHAWQFSTRDHSHTLFSLPAGATLADFNWHSSLAGAASEATPIHNFNHDPAGVRDHWYAGPTAYAGAACYQGHPYRREATHLGLEDAWVLSRMLENYEEDYADGLAEYERFRRARVQRAARNGTATVALYDRHTLWGRTRRNLNVALAARFLPEIAMQRIDWLYNYDCIRGFR